MITDVIRRATGASDFELYGSGRTDAGVHALEQIAHLDLAEAPPPDILRLRINDLLPSDIHVLRIEAADARFHARHHAVARSYLYQVARRRTAFGKRLVWWVKDPLDVERMRRAAALFVGMKDVQSFAAGGHEEQSTKVLIESVELAEAGALILIRVVGSHFLWRMVRRIVGVVVEAGRGKLELDAVRGFLSSRSEEPARLAAPASGLFLERVYYEGQPRLDRLEPVIRIQPHEGTSAPAAAGAPPRRAPRDRRPPPRGKRPKKD